MYPSTAPYLNNLSLSLDTLDGRPNKVRGLLSASHTSEADKPVFILKVEEEMGQGTQDGDFFFIIEVYLYIILYLFQVYNIVIQRLYRL